MVSDFAAGKLRAARRLHEQYYPLFKDLFIDTNPVPVKAALAMMGQIENELRLPLVPLGKAGTLKLRATLKACKVLR
jgi:4-hydroxy-tetrahydrodipicolinate synthase